MLNRAARFDRLRGEHDRFVAFAFAAADVLLELDSEQRIQYARGATRALFERDEADLVGAPLLDLVSFDDHERLRAALGAIPTGSRMPPIAVRLRDPSARRVVVSGYRLPDREGHYYLAIDPAKRPLTSAPPRSPERDRATGLFCTEAFGGVVRDRVEAATKAGGNYALTLFALGRFARMSSEAGRRAVSHIGDTLRAISVDGDSAGVFEGDTYGVLHERSLDVDALRAQVCEMTRRFDPAGVGSQVRAATIDATSGAMSHEDTAKAVGYTVNKFVQTRGDGFTITSLAQGCEERVRETVSQIAELKHIVNDGQFNIALQPIVDLTTRRTHRYEALARFDRGGKASPFRIIALAEEVGVISAFDLAMVQRAIELLASAERSGRKIGLAVNLSGRSLSSPMFVESLLALLRRHPAIRQSLWFEITESAKIDDLGATNRRIQNLRAAGYNVCLDDFGTGATAFQLLRALAVDVIKIDGVHVREALTTATGRCFLKALANLCRDLDIDVVAEMVEDNETVEGLRECGVRYGQGYLFGRPALAGDASRSIPAAPMGSLAASFAARPRPTAR